MTNQRITRENLDARVANLNRRMESRGSIYRYSLNGRNGYTAVDRIRRDPDSPNLGESGRWITHSHVTAGTKREIGDWLSAAMVALDDASVDA